MVIITRNLVVSRRAPAQPSDSHATEETVLQDAAAAAPSRSFTTDGASVNRRRCQRLSCDETGSAAAGWGVGSLDALGAGWLMTFQKL